MSLISLLIAIIVFGLIFYVVQTLLPLPQPWKNIALVVVCLIAIVVLLQFAGIGTGLRLS